MNKSCVILIFILICSDSVFCQETGLGPGYQTILMSNPAYTGTSIDGTLRLSYFNFLPGNHYNFHSVFLSYDSYLPAIHGGTGLYISNDYLGGIANDLRGGISYSYFLKAGKELYINAGLSASVFHRGFNFNDAVFPDQIDAMGRISGISSELMTRKNETVFDVGTGIMFIYKNITGGFAVTHLTQPDLNRSIDYIERLNRKYVLNFMADLGLTSKLDLRIHPLAYAELQGKYLSVAAGTVVGNNSISVSTIILVNNYGSTDIQTGLIVKRDKLSLFYNYRFNINSGNNLLPFSLLHQIGVSISLNVVEKRINIRTINVPSM